MVYIRYSQFEANKDGTPKQFNNKASFSSHKSRKKNCNVIFSNISVNGKGVLFLTIVINENQPISFKIVSFPSQLDIEPMVPELHPEGILVEIQVQLFNIRISMSTNQLLCPTSILLLSRF